MPSKLCLLDSSLLCGSYFIMSKKFESNWFTINSYNNDFKYPEKTSGVYMLVKCDVSEYGLNSGYKKEIVYIGSSKNLKQRYQRHEVIKILKEVYDYIQFYFRETQNYRTEEIKLIKLHKPKFNKQHNG